MVRQRLEKLIKVLREDIKDFEVVAKSSRKAAQEVTGGVLTSYSAAGDIEHATNAANLNEEKVNKMKLLLDELEEALELPIPEKIEPVSFFWVKFSDGNLGEFFLVDNPVYVEGFKIISKDSPIGKVVLGKKVGEGFEYEVDGGRTSGVVLGIE